MRHERRTVEGSPPGERTVAGSPPEERMVAGSPPEERMVEGSPPEERTVEGSPPEERTVPGSPLEGAPDDETALTGFAPRAPICVDPGLEMVLRHDPAVPGKAVARLRTGAKGDYHDRDLGGD